MKKLNLLVLVSLTAFLVFLLAGCGQQKPEPVIVEPFEIKTISVNAINSREAWEIYGDNSIASDNHNNIHIIFYESRERGLEYATNRTGSWEISVIDSSLGVGSSNSIAIDSNNSIHISYYDEKNCTLKYATNKSGFWDISILESLDLMGQPTSIKVDKDNNIHIAYYDNQNQCLKYITNKHVKTLASWPEPIPLWEISIVDSQIVGGSISLALDNEGNPCITYLDGINKVLRFATYNLGSWNTSPIESVGMFYWDSSLVIDKNNKAHISYYNSKNDTFNYATNRTGSWEIITLDSKGCPGFYNSIAIDKNNKVHIVYLDKLDSDLKYITDNSGSWESFVIDCFANGDCSIAVDKNNKAHISYFSFDNNFIIKYAQKI